MLDPIRTNLITLNAARRKPATFIVVGKPGAGKTKLAKSLAATLNLELLEVGRILETISKGIAAEAKKSAEHPSDEVEEADEEDNEPIEPPTALGREAYRLLAQGLSLPVQMSLQLVRERAESPACAFRGYVLDGFPLPTDSTDPWSPEAQLNYIKSWTLKPEYSIILQISDYDLQVRHSGFLLDPNTGILYSKADLQPLQAVNTKNVEEEVNSNNPDETAAPVQDDDETSDYKPVEFKASPSEPPEVEVQQRLIKRSQDLELHEFPALNRYKTVCLKVVEAFLSTYHPQFRFEISAVHPAHIILEHAMAHITSRNLPLVTKPVVLEPLVAKEFASDAEMISEMCANGVSEEGLPWVIGPTSVYCPVTLMEQRDLIRGNPEFIAAYQGSVYAFISEEARNKFVKSPVTYIKVAPQPLCRVCIITAHDFTDLALELGTSVAAPFTGSVIEGEAAFASQLPTTLSKDWVIVNSIFGLEDLEKLSPSLKPLLYAVINPHLDATVTAVIQQVQAIGGIVIDLSSQAASKDSVESLVAILVDKMKQTLAQPGLDTIHEHFDGEDTEDSGYGDYKHFCPVSLVQSNVLRPGSGDYAVKYEGRIYQMVSAEARVTFVAQPTHFIRETPPVAPALRVLLLGPAAAGKSTQARKLARRLRCFHISFPERLQEVALSVENEFTEEITKHLSSPNEFNLSSEAAVSVIRQFWVEEPYRSRGIILEGFPRTADELRLMLDNNLFADVCISLTATDETVLKRRMPKAMAAFEKKHQKLIEERDARNLARELARQRRMDEWKAQAALKRQERIAQRREQGEEVEEEDEPEDEYIDMEEEDAPEPDIEEMAAARERIEQELSYAYSADVGRVSEVSAMWSDEYKLPLEEINGDRREELVKLSFERALAPFTMYRANLFFSAQKVTLATAESLLAGGHVQRSSFGPWCPNQLFNGTAIQPTRTLRFPVIYRGLVYYFASEADRSAFFVNSTALLNQPAPPAPVPVRIAIVGPPRSGKSTLANKICEQYGCLRVTIGSALRYLLDTYPNLELSLLVRDHLLTGDRVPDEMCIEAIKFMISSAQAHVFGYVFDGFPTLKTQTEFMTERLIIPYDVLSLNISESVAEERNNNGIQSVDDVNLYNHSNSTLKVRFAKFHETIASVKAWYTSQHRNWTDIDATGSKWKLLDIARQKLEASVRRQQRYLRDVEAGQAASIDGLCLMPSELSARVGHFQTYCPVSWVNEQKLFPSSATNVQFAAEYKFSYFYMCNATCLEAFKASPEKYWQGRLPQNVPVRKASSDIKLTFPLQYAFQGFCPVAYVVGNKAYECLVAGDPAIVVEYAGRSFSFFSEENLALFMQSPHRYADIELPPKLPPRVEPMNVSKLPMLGYMEQTCAALVTRSMTAVGLQKPKYPFLTSTQSAQLYLALYLKAWNPKSSEYARALYRKKLRAFEERCGLATYLGHAMQSSFTSERPIDLDHKLKVFMSLSPAK